MSVKVERRAEVIYIDLQGMTESRRFVGWVGFVDV